MAKEINDGGAFITNATVLAADKVLLKREGSPDTLEQIAISELDIRTSDAVKAASGIIPIPVSNASFTLSEAQVKQRVIWLTGILTANIVISTPNVTFSVTIRNKTSGSFSITIGGTPIPQGSSAEVEHLAT